MGFLKKILPDALNSHRYPGTKENFTLSEYSAKKV
jgi:hypothetical protein